MDALTRAIGPWGAPADGAAWGALAAVVVLVAVAWRRPEAILRPRRGAFACGSAAIAALLSFLYSRAYLDGAPRIVDATTYYLQAKTLASGHFAFRPDGALASFHGRFLVETPDGRLAGLFPPGYPLLLSLFVRAGAPMLLGPVLAACLALATYALYKEVAYAEHRDGVGAATSSDDAELGARVAALLSAFSAALRYHTADTMSHGAAALYVALFAWAMTRLARRQGDRSSSLLLAAVVGASASALLATRFASALPLLIVTGVAIAQAWRTENPRHVFALVGVGAAAATPFVALLLFSQHAITGDPLRSAQSAYYAVSDGPPGCFRYGFGAGIGCLYEHGEYVAKALPNGFGPWAATAATLRRLKAHLVDAGNVELFGLFLPVAMVVTRRVRQARLLSALIVLQVAAYAPFYFDGSYPGGGGRFYADVLPLEHVLIALGALTLAKARRRRPSRAMLAVLATSLAGFAVHASHTHALLRGAVLGPRYFDASLVEVAEKDVRARTGHGAIFFVDSDHGFALGFDPTNRGPRVARYRDDALDQLLVDGSGVATAFRYRTDGARGHLEPLVIPRGDWPRFEGESLWPPKSQSGGYAVPEWIHGTCVSHGRALVLHRTGAARATVMMDVPTPFRGRATVALAVLLAGEGSARLDGDEPRRLPSLGPSDATPRCAEVDLGAHTFDTDTFTVSISTTGENVAVDAIIARPQADAAGRK